MVRQHVKHCSAWCVEEIITWYLGIPVTRRHACPIIGETDTKVIPKHWNKNFFNLGKPKYSYSIEYSSGFIHIDNSVNKVRIVFKLCINWTWHFPFVLASDHRSGIWESILQKLCLCPDQYKSYDESVRISSNQVMNCMDIFYEWNWNEFFKPLSSWKENFRLLKEASQFLTAAYKGQSL